MSVAAVLPAETAARCAHCGQEMAEGTRFCCPGCAAAFDAIQAMGLGRYYQRRVVDPTVRPLRPEPADGTALARFVAADGDGTCTLQLMIDGLQCGACVWLIESVLAEAPDLIEGRVNMTTRRLRLKWRGGAERAAELVGRIERLGYRLVPFDAAALKSASAETQHRLLRALAVAGFAAGNLMLISIGIWAGLSQGMGDATRGLMHWVSAVIALPAIAYAGLPFFTSAAAVLRRGRTNMDVPISIGVLLVTAMSLVETMRGGTHTYFDSAAALLFFLLIGRVLDHHVRNRARQAAEQLLGLRSTDVAIVAADGALERCAVAQVAPGARVLVGMGERVGVDGTIDKPAEGGKALIDASLVTGESLPEDLPPGAAVFAGSLNLGSPFTMIASATGEATLLAECARLIDAAEQSRGRFVALADRVARRYAPVVHVTAAATYLAWWLMGAGWNTALMNAAAVLIITCPCAVALAVPVVQVIATGGLFRKGILLKSPTVLERLAGIDMVVFDKTGTLTEPGLALQPGISPADLQEAARLAVASRHPLARTLAAAAGPAAPAGDIVERPGQGLARTVPGGEIRLGSRAFCGIGATPPPDGPELWFTRPGKAPLRFAFAERLREDAAAAIAGLKARGYAVRLLSGDRPEAVAPIAALAGIADWQAGLSPVDKVAALEKLRHAGRRVLMVGDGLNDGPALAAAAASMSPSTASDVTQNVADVVFQGRLIAPVATALSVAKRADRLIRQNLVLAIGYNFCAVPLAIAGFVTPWLAALAMSSSSLAVILNSFRLERRS
jgi:Cu2+-exporting ATPase